MEQKELIDAYRNYLKETGGSPAWAISPQLAGFIVQIQRFKDWQPKTVLDLGSGFTSWLLRVLFPCANVRSLDHDPRWLSLTKGYLERKGVSSDGLELYQPGSDWGGSYDLIILDLGVPQREQLIPSLYRALEPGGILICDDAHRPSLANACAALEQEHGAELHWLWMTLDEFGRYACALSKPSV